MYKYIISLMCLLKKEINMALGIPSTTSEAERHNYRMIMMASLCGNLPMFQALNDLCELPHLILAARAGTRTREATYLGHRI